MTSADGEIKLLSMKSRIDLVQQGFKIKGEHREEE